MLLIEFELEYGCTEADMFSVFSIGPSELVILSGVTGMVCGALLVGSVVIAVLLLRRRAAYRVEEE
jgi:hypothetical protein